MNLRELSAYLGYMETNAVLELIKTHSLPMPINGVIPTDAKARWEQNEVDQKLDVAHVTPGPLIRSDGALTPAQVRSARSLLGWSRVQLRLQSGIAERSIGAYENSGHMPATNLSHQRADRLAAIRAAFEKAGVEFVDRNRGGRLVRLRPDRPN